MAQPKATPSEFELEILQVIWEVGEATSEFVVDTFDDSRPADAQQVTATLNAMVERGLLRVKGKKTLIYVPTVEREATLQSLIKGVANRLTEGSVYKLMMLAMGQKTKALSSEERAQLRQMLDDKKDK